MEYDTLPIRLVGQYTKGLYKRQEETLEIEHNVDLNSIPQK